MAELLTVNPTIRTSYTREQYRQRVLSDIAQADRVFINNDDLDRWGLEAQNIIAREAQWYQFLETIQTSGGVRDYDLPANCIAINMMQWDIFPLAEISLLELYQLNPLWRQMGPTIPRYYYIGGASRITLHPTPNGASGLLVIYSALPPAPAADLDFYYAPVGGEEALVYYGCWKASMKDAGREGLKRAQGFGAMWEMAKKKIVAQSRALGANSALVFGGGRVIRAIDPIFSRQFVSAPLPSGN